MKKIATKFEILPFFSESGYEEDGIAQVHHSPTSPDIPALASTDNTQSPARTMKLQNSEDIYAVIDKSRASPAKTPKVGSMSYWLISVK
mgnify:CR=1 FL=1